MQITLACLIADGTVKWVIGKDKLHYSPSSIASCFGIGVYAHRGGDLRAAGCDRFWGFLNLDKAHTTVSCHFESLMIAETRDCDPVLFGSLEDGEVVGYLVGFAVYKHLDFLGGEGCEQLETGF